MSQSPPAIPVQISGLSKTYRLGFFLNRRVKALQGLDLSIEPGQIYGLLGPNGAGKSTTIKILMNLVTASSGEARLFGEPATQHKVRRQVGFLPENPAPYEYLTGREFVTLSGQLAGLSGHDLDQRVTRVIGQVEMAGAEKLQIRRYSKGMVQRVSLAQALVHDPKLLILDEPTSGLDPIGRRQMRDLILAERHRGTTVLFCSHIIPDVEVLCDRLAVLVGGKRVREGSVSELLSQGSNSVELVVEGMDAEKLASLGPSVSSVKKLEGRVIADVTQEDAQRVLAQVLSSGGRVSRLTPSKFSLEQLFLTAVKEADRPSVGGEIS